MPTSENEEDSTPKRETKVRIKLWVLSGVYEGQGISKAFTSKKEAEFVAEDCNLLGFHILETSVDINPELILHQ